MLFNLSAGEVIHIGEAVTLTILAVEGDLVRFKLESPEGECPGAEDTSKGCDGADLKQRRKGWEWN